MRIFACCSQDLRASNQQTVLFYFFPKWLKVAQSGFTAGKATLSHLGKKSQKSLW